MIKLSHMHRMLLPIGIAATSLGTHAATATFADNKLAFLVSTAATSIGALPSSGGTGTVVGSATFTNGPNATITFSNFSNEISGNELAASGVESFNIAIAGGVYSIGFDLHEPAYVGSASPVNGCNATCVDTTFSIQIFSGTTSLGLFTYNAPDDLLATAGGPVGFFGVQSSTAFNRFEVRDLSGTIDNEFFGGFLSGNQALPIPEPTPSVLLCCGFLGILALTRFRSRVNASPAQPTSGAA